MVSVRLLSGCVRADPRARPGIWLALALTAVLMAAPAVGARESVRVVASFSILADLVQQVGGPLVKVTSLIPPDSDAHLYEPRPTDVRTFARAQLIIVNGLGYEPWLERLIEASRTGATTIVASEGVQPLTQAFHEAHMHGHDHKHGDGDFVDPHAWLNVRNVIVYVRNIAAALCVVAPRECAQVTQREQTYREQLQQLDATIKTQMAAIPTADRTVVSAHASFGYFANAYNVRFLSPLGINTEARPSARAMAKVIDHIRDNNVRAVFFEKINDPRLLERIVVETHANIGGHLYSDALSVASGEAPTYVTLMQHNARVIAKSLQP